VTDEDLKSLMERQGKAVVECALTGLKTGAPADRVAVVWVLPESPGYERMRAQLAPRVGQDCVYALGADGIVFGTLRRMAQQIMHVEGHLTLAEELGKPAPDASFVLVVLRETAMLRHITVEAHTGLEMQDDEAFEPWIARLMSKGGSA
jgi:hypothetical protein